MINHQTKILFYVIFIWPSTCLQAQRITIPINTASENNTKLEQKLVCPSKDEQEGRFAKFFSIPCKRVTDCTALVPTLRCCKGFCVQGVLPLPKEPPHERVFGIRRSCPKVAVSEFLPVQKCNSDVDCEIGRRICCPDKKDKQLYCRIPSPNWMDLPLQRTHNVLKSVMMYIQCKPPPPNYLGIFSKPCRRTADCFPNLCCQEGPKKYCRPPRKSIISLAGRVTGR